MPKIELGTVGAVLSPGDGNAFIDTAVELEDLGYQTIWLTGGPLQSLSQIESLRISMRLPRRTEGLAQAAADTARTPSSRSAGSV